MQVRALQGMPKKGNNMGGNWLSDIPDINNKKSLLYKGYTYYFPQKLLFLWKKVLCKRNWHLWDEVSTYNNGPKRYFICDACGEKEELKVSSKGNKI